MRGSVLSILSAVRRRQDLRPAEHGGSGQPDRHEAAGHREHDVQGRDPGETLSGLLLSAYAFGTMGPLAGIGAIVPFIGGGC